MPYTPPRTGPVPDPLPHRTPDMTRILLADDHDLVRETVAAYLLAEGFDEVAVASDVEGALALLAGGPFDLILADYDMPGMKGLAGLGRLIAANAGRPVAVITGAPQAELAEAALDMGAAGFLPKTLGTRQLVAAVGSMLAGGIFLPADLVRKGRETLLSPREAEVLRGICAGKSNKEIARDYGLQEVTVKLHVKTMSRKLGAKNRTHAAMIARDRQLV